MNSAAALKDLLVTAGVGVFNASTGWAIFVNKMPTSPDTVIVVTHFGGANPNPKYSLDFPSVQCMIRGAPNGDQAAEQKANDVKNALLGIPSQDVAGGRMVSITMAGDISYLGEDENGRSMRSLNFSLIVEPADTGNRIAL